MSDSSTNVESPVDTPKPNDYIVDDDFLNSEECELLRSYCESTLNAQKDTNTINVNPMYNNRVVYYEGVRDSPEIKALMKSIHDRVANLLTDFYGEGKNPIYPEATHLVKWPQGTCLGYHADNAYEDGTPNYVSWRTHSGVLYLNDNYEGGCFYFKKEYPKMHKTKTGQLMAFTGGMDHVHAVQTVTKGTRYAMPMWFCQDRSRAYPEYR